MAKQVEFGEALRAVARHGRARVIALVRALVHALACALPIALTACMGYDIEAVRDLNPETGDGFTQTLAEDYRRFALFEADEMYDWIDAGHFADKGLQAGAGTEVEPERLDDWHLPADSVPQLQDARAALETALQDRAAGDQAARFAARAQVNFDCWVEQQEENHQWDDIAACRDGFYNDLSRLSAFLKSQSEAERMPAALPERPAGESAEAGVPFAVTLFAFDSSALDDAAQAVVAAVAEQAERMPEATLVVVGHTDRRGTETYNLDLSLRRAEALRDALIERGLDSDRIQTIGRGEWDQAVPTADGVREPANRRVEVFVVTGGGDPALSSQETQIPVAPAGADAVQGDLGPGQGCAGTLGGAPAATAAQPRDGRTDLDPALGDCRGGVHSRALGQQSQLFDRTDHAVPWPAQRPAEPPPPAATSSAIESNKISYIK